MTCAMQACPSGLTRVSTRRRRQWAGHGMDVMLRVYAKCSAGQREIANQRIEGALAS
ncbi:UNVERIFIED_ORG: hypothetical protein FHR35_008742 [Microbispora rosea subsp. rosea]